MPEHRKPPVDLVLRLAVGGGGRVGDLGGVLAGDEAHAAAASDVPDGDSAAVAGADRHHRVAVGLGTRTAAVRCRAPRMPATRRWRCSHAVSPGRRTGYKADEIASLGTGEAISQWDDASRHDRHATQITAGRRPTYAPGILNGLPVVRFDGGDNYLNTPLACNSACSRYRLP